AGDSLDRLLSQQIEIAGWRGQEDCRRIWRTGTRHNGEAHHSSRHGAEDGKRFLGSWFGKAEGVVVDTHVQRISRRLELTRETEAGKIEQDLMRILPRDQWIDFSHRVIWHGRALCVARKPKCIDCKLEKVCYAADKTWSTVEIHKSAKP